MANEPYTITNQKLYFSKVAIADWQKVTTENTTNINLLKVYQQQTVFHLYTCLWAVYNEVASYYRIPLLSANSALREWLTEDFIKEYPSAELNELFALLNTDSFVATISHAWEKIFTPVTTTKQSAITLVNVNSDIEHYEQAQQVLAQLNELVVRFRAGLSEY